MSRYLNNPGEVPPKAWPEQKEQGFAFKHGETGQLIVAPSWKDLLTRVQRFYRANNFPIGGNFEQEIQDQLCGQLPGNYCTDNNPNRTAEVARADWPEWATLVALKAQPGDRGVGDVVARIVGPFGGDLFKSWYQKIFNKPCGCQERQENLNALYPLHL